MDFIQEYVKIAVRIVPTNLLLWLPLFILALILSILYVNWMC